MSASGAVRPVCRQLPGLRGQGRRRVGREHQQGGGRRGRVGGRGHRGASSRITWALVPPKPKELTPARRGRSAVVVQGVQLHGDLHGPAPIDVGTGLAEMQVGRQGLVGQGQADLDQAGDPGGAFQVSEVGLDRADAQRPLRIALGCEDGAARPPFRSGRPGRCRCRGLPRNRGRAV